MNASLSPNPVVSSFTTRRHPDWQIRRYANGMYDAAQTDGPGLSPGSRVYVDVVRWLDDQEAPQFDVIDRDAVPAGSFVYGQRADVDGLDVGDDSWLVATECAKADEDGDGFSTVLVVHFIHREQLAAFATARNLQDVGPVTIIRPVA